MEHINGHNFSTTSWELEMAMEDQILHDHKIPLTSIYSFQHHHHHHIPLNQLPSSSDLISEQRVHNNNNNNNNQLDDQEQPPPPQEQEDEEEEELGAMKEMMFKIAAMQPVDIDPAAIHKPKRRNVRISDDPQSVAARHRRERISEKIRILQRLVPGGTKMDTASMLEEAGRYIKFLRRQIRHLQADHQSRCIGSVMGCLPVVQELPVTFHKPIGESSGSFSVEPVAHPTYSGAAAAAGHELVNFNHEI